jgi:hypothetical protein
MHTDRNRRPSGSTASPEASFIHGPTLPALLDDIAWTFPLRAPRPAHAQGSIPHSAQPAA